MSPPKDLNQWARQWRAPMLRFAQLHIQPREEAEDAVQDALMALLSVRDDQVAGQDLKRYVFGILKHKITDRLRRKYRTETAVDDLPVDALDDELFDARGHWLDGAAPAAWNAPDAQLQSDQFFAVVDACIHRLPAKVARVFSMKELLDCDAREVCDTLGLTQSDYWQCMSRARKQIQLCLTQTWFEGSRS